MAYQRNTLPVMPPSVAEVSSGANAKHKQTMLLTCSCAAGEFKPYKLPTEILELPLMRLYKLLKDKYQNEDL